MSHSSAAYVMYVALQSYFSAYVFGSPSLWWDKQIVLREVKGRSETENGVLSKAKHILITVGGDEKEHMVRGIARSCCYSLRFCRSCALYVSPSLTSMVHYLCL